jgi:hypothetical protein
MCESSHGKPGSDSWVSLIFGELREEPKKTKGTHRTLEPT